MKRLLCVCVFLLSAPLMAQSPEQVVNNAYEEVLGRKADDTGMREYRSKVIEKGWSEEDIKKKLRKSEEYHVRAITMAYEDVLGRKPDAAGMENYKRKMQKGWTEKEIRNELRKSPEYKKR